MVKEKLKKLEEQAKICKACSLYKTKTNTIFGDGNINASVLFIGEAPDKIDDKIGAPFSNRAGKLLRTYLKEVGFRDDEFYLTNTVKCLPIENKKPSKEEKRSCEYFLNKQIELINPKYVVLLGSVALESFVLNKKMSVTKIRGQIFEINKRKFIPTFNPSYLLRYFGEYEGSPKDLFKKDLKMIKELIENV